MPAGGSSSSPIGSTGDYTIVESERGTTVCCAPVQQQQEGQESRLSGPEGGSVRDPRPGARFQAFFAV